MRRRLTAVVAVMALFVGPGWAARRGDPSLAAPGWAVGGVTLGEAQKLIVWLWQGLTDGQTPPTPEPPPQPAPDNGICVDPNGRPVPCSL